MGLGLGVRLGLGPGLHWLGQLGLSGLQRVGMSWLELELKLVPGLKRGWALRLRLGWGQRLGSKLRQGWGLALGLKRRGQGLRWRLALAPRLALAVAWRVRSGLRLKLGLELRPELQMETVLAGSP